MGFQRFEIVRNQRGGSFGTIDKTGRLFFPQEIVAAAGLAHDQHVEIYFDRDGRKIGLQRVPDETVYSVRVRRNGQAHKDGSESLCVSVQTLLGEYKIMVPKRIRGRMGVQPDGMVVFAFETVASVALPQNGALTGAPAQENVRGSE